jgi:hypothetical protein
MDLNETCCGNVDWINVDHNRTQWHAIANMVIYLWVLQKAGNFLTTEAAISISRILVTDVRLLLRLVEKIFIIFPST